MSRKKIAIALDLDWPLKRYHELYKGIQHYAKEHTDWILTWDHFPECELQKSKTTPFYNGIIGRINKSIYHEAQRFGISLVNTWLSGNIKNIPSIYPDYESIAVDSIEHLRNRGFKNFACIDYIDDKSSAIFRKKAIDVCNENNYTLKNYYIERQENDDKEYLSKLRNYFKTWVQEWTYPMGIISTNCFIIPTIISYCKEHGIRIPDQLAIITSENEIVYTETHRPHITSVDINYFNMGFEAAKLLDMQDQGIDLDNQSILFPPSGIIHRDSTETYSVNDIYLKQSLRFMNENFKNNKFNINQITEQVPISRRSLEIKFKKELGHSILDGIQRMRLDLAKRMLLETNETIIHIQKYVGFSNPLHMRRAFLKYLGMPPKEYRDSKLNYN